MGNMMHQECKCATGRLLSQALTSWGAEIDPTLTSDYRVYFAVPPTFGFLRESTRSHSPKSTLRLGTLGADG